MYDPEYDAIVTVLRGTFYPRPFSDTANLDLAGYAIGSAPIGPGWLKVRRSFNSAASAEDFLRGLIPEQAHAYGEDHAVLLEHTTYNARIDALAHDLVAGQQWCLPVYPKFMNCPGLAMQTAGPHTLGAAQMTTINSALGSNVDLQFIWSQEGSQWLRGYAVLQGKLHTNVQKSGVTIGTGFDIGQQGAADLARMGLGAEVTVLLTPYLGVKFIKLNPGHAAHHRDYTDMTGNEVAKVIANIGPLPILTKPQADDLDRRGFIDKIKSAQKLWDGANHARHRPAHQHHGHHATASPPAPAQAPSATAAPPPALKAFTALSKPWQTVLVDWVFQFGPGVFQSQNFARSALAGDAAAAKAQLAVRPGTRRQQESRLLANDTTTLVTAPAAVPKPAAPPPPLPAPAR